MAAAHRRAQARGPLHMLRCYCRADRRVRPAHVLSAGPHVYRRNRGAARHFCQASRLHRARRGEAGAGVDVPAARDAPGAGGIPGQGACGQHRCVSCRLQAAHVSSEAREADNDHRRSRIVWWMVRRLRAGAGVQALARQDGDRNGQPPLLPPDDEPQPAAPWTRTSCRSTRTVASW